MCGCQSAAVANVWREQVRHEHVEHPCVRTTHADQGPQTCSPCPPQTRLRPPGEGMFGKLFGGGKAEGGAAEAQQQQQQQAPERGVEFPPFQTVSKGAAYDLRFYEPYPVVEMDYRRRVNGYLTLGEGPRRGDGGPAGGA
mgnify:CR=1 FL=1